MWVTHNFGLTLSAVTLRAQLGILFGAGVDFDTFYPYLAWTAWLPNIVATTLWFALSKRRAAQAVATAGYVVLKAPESAQP